MAISIRRCCKELEIGDDGFEEGTKLPDGLVGGSTVGRLGGGGVVWFGLEFMDEVSDGSGKAISGGIIWEPALDGEEFHSTVFPGAMCVINPEGVVSVLLHTWTNIPTLFSMISKGGGTVFRGDIDDASGTKGSQGGAIEIKFSKDLVVSGEFGIDPGVSEQVEGDDGLWEKLIPETSREALISSVQNGGEVIFKSADSTFSWVVAVIR